MMEHKGMNIGFCENGAGYGGAVISLASFLKQIPIEFKSHIYTGIGTKEYQELSDLGIWRHVPTKTLIDPVWLKKHRVPFASMIDNVCNIAPHALRYCRAFKREAISLVYLNNDPSCNLAPALAARLLGIPMVLHARGFSANTRGNRWVLSNIKHCIAVSNAIKNQLIELGLPPKKCTVIPEGLDLRLFHPRPPSKEILKELNLSETASVVTLVGGLIDWKGQDVLLEACPHIFEEFPDTKILLVGSAYGKDNHFANLIARQANAPILKGRVRLLGGRTDIPDILSVSSIVLHASTKPEPFGRTFLEGMAMGKPVIASDEGGPSEVITNEVDGLLIPPRDPKLLSEAVIRLLKDRVFADNLAQNAAIKATNYSIERHAATISAILRNV